MRVAAAAILALASAATVLALPPADQPENIIIKLSSDGHSGFSVRSSAAADGTGDLGTPIGDRLRRVRRLPDETTEEALKRLQSMDGARCRGCLHTAAAAAPPPPCASTRSSLPSSPSLPPAQAWSGRTPTSPSSPRR